MAINEVAQPSTPNTCLLTDEQNAKVRNAKSNARAAAAVTIVGLGASHSLRFISNMALAGLLYPEAFGLMALVNVFLQGLAMFSDLGVQVAIIKSDRYDDKDFLNTAWTLQACRGFALAIVALIAARPLAQMFGQSELAQLLSVASLTAVISGFNSTKIATNSRAINVKPLVVIDITTQIVGASVSVLAVYLTSSVWGLVTGHICAAIYTCLISHLALPGVANYPCWEKHAATELFVFGRWIFISTATTFLAFQTDRLAFGYLAPLSVLGIYHFASQIAAIPKQIMTAIGARVIYPLISQHAALSRKEMKQKIERNRDQLLWPAAIGLSLIVVCVPDMIHAIYDDRYKSAGWIASVLAFSLWPKLLEVTMGNVLLVVGSMRISTLACAARFIWLAIATPIGFLAADTEGAVLAVACADVIFYVITATGLQREGLYCARQDTLATVLFASSLVLFYVAREIVLSLS